MMTGGGGGSGKSTRSEVTTTTATTTRGKNSTTARGTGGMHLRWTRIVKTVEMKEGGVGLLRGSIAGGAPASPAAASATSAVPASTTTRTILDRVSGTANPGEVLALMGPSGSGKTSILDVLSGRSSHDGTGGITLDGIPVDGRLMKKMKKRVAYVKQDDIFFGHLTVRDQLTYTALLRLPSAMPKCDKIDEVNRTIRRLRLSRCADTPINMISGGERKRVNIGSELLTDPSIILLDEPTSGLDSTSAVGLINILRELATIEGKTIITSIHQPSSAVFFGFDRLMLLSDGHVVYFGTPRGSLVHVAALGMECPPGYNAADHHMDLLVVDGTIDDDDDNDVDDEEMGGTTATGSEEDRVGSVNGKGKVRRRRSRGTTTTGMDGTTTKRMLLDSWDAEAFAKRIEDEDAAGRDAFDDGVVVEDIKGGKAGGGMRGLGASSNRGLSRQESVVLTEKSFNATWWTQYKVLVHRSMKNSRSAIFTTLNFVKAGAIGFMCGLL